MGKTTLKTLTNNNIVSQSEYSLLHKKGEVL